MKYYRIEYKDGICHYVFSWNVKEENIEQVRKHCIEINNDDDITHALVFYQGTECI